MANATAWSFSKTWTATFGQGLALSEAVCLMLITRVLTWNDMVEHKRARIESELTKTTSFAKTDPGAEVNFFRYRLRCRTQVQEENEWSVEVRNRSARRIGALESVEFAYRGFISDRCDLARQGEAGFLEEHPDRIVAAP